MPQKINGINLGSKRKGEKEIQKKEKKERALTAEKKCKPKCCKKYKKSESKRCTKCPMFDLLKKVA